MFKFSVIHQNSLCVFGTFVRAQCSFLIKHFQKRLTCWLVTEAGIVLSRIHTIKWRICLFQHRLCTNTGRDRLNAYQTPSSTLPLPLTNDTLLIVCSTSGGWKGWFSAHICSEVWKLILQDRQITRTANGRILYPKHLVFVFLLCWHVPYVWGMTRSRADCVLVFCDIFWRCTSYSGLHRRLINWLSYFVIPLIVQQSHFSQLRQKDTTCIIMFLWRSYNKMI